MNGHQLAGVRLWACVQRALTLFGKSLKLSTSLSPLSKTLRPMELVSVSLEVDALGSYLHTIYIKL